MFAILDIEATGGKVGEESIIDIAIFRYDGQTTVDQFISLVNPMRKIDPFVQKLTNITDKMVLTAPKFHEIAKRIVEITEDCILVGHNVKFDYRMLRQEFKKLGYDYEKDWIDTFEFAQKLIPNMESYSLGKLTNALGIPITDRHRASGDARATLKLFQLLRDKDSEKIIQKKSGLRTEKKVKEKYQKLLENLPTKTGLFYFYNRLDDIIFIGRSSNIAYRVNRYFSSKNFESSKIKRYTKYITYEVTGSELLAEIKEVHEINLNQPFLNIKIIKSKTPYGLYFIPSKRSYYRLEIGKGRKAEPILTFARKETALEFLQKVTLEYNLCPKINLLQPSSASCFSYEMGQCKGACIRKENPKTYNERVEALVNRTNYPTETFILSDKGRKTGEHAFFFIDQGKFVGYGYYELHHQIKNRERIMKIVNPFDTNPTIELLIKKFIFLNKQEGIYSIEE
ncbi:exonuclease domain-containing protein [uncultured Weeksella sp.]|uniref:exonuclease domain-containing protein n=1 Tax=uncultured Weeksella sp. TaxID=1161389 RepID=UPI00259BC96F|nr:exonuclease domain-containing protein [uncultured Weeksella sp.]